MSPATVINARDRAVQHRVAARNCRDESRSVGDTDGAEMWQDEVDSWGMHIDFWNAEMRKRR